MSSHAGPTIAELVRLDLVHRESEGALTAFHVGPEALLDAYDQALETACLLRAIIEEMTVGDGTLDRPTPVPSEPPHFRAARGHAEGECGVFVVCTHATHATEPGS